MPVLTTANVQQEFVGYKLLPEKMFTKNQVSSNIHATIASAIGRYLKRQPFISNRKSTVIYSELCSGLSRAIFGKSDRWNKVLAIFKGINHDDLRYHAHEYIIALQKKN